MMSKGLRSMTDNAQGERPRRIQRKRTKGWKMPENTVYVGRGSDFGNPYKAPTNDALGRAYAVAQFAAYCPPDSTLALAARRTLAGKNLACWCPLDQPCHADVLLDLANPQDPPMPRTELINRVRDAAARGLSYAQTAEELGITKNAVAGLAARNGISFGLSPLFWSDDEVDQLEQLIEAGFSPVEVARRMNRSAPAIRSKAHDLGASWRSANRAHANDNYKAPVTLPRLKFLENAKKEAA